MCMSENTTAKVIQLTFQSQSLTRGQEVRFKDPDLLDHPQGPVYTYGKVKGFDDDRGDVLVILDGEPDAARRFKPTQLRPA